MSQFGLLKHKFLILEIAIQPILRTKQLRFWIIFLAKLFFVGCIPQSNPIQNQFLQDVQQQRTSALFGGAKIAKTDPILKSVAFIPFGTIGYCSGAFISKDLVITAAHCMVRAPYKPTEIKFFDVRQDENYPSKQSLKIKTITVHPNFTDTTEGKNFDVALLQLEPYDHSNFSSITPMIILSDEKMNQIPEKIIVAGAGTIKADQPLYDDYHSGSILVDSIDQNFLVLDQRHGVGACAGDSGAAVFYNDQSNGLILAAILQGPYKTSPKTCTQFGQAVILSKVKDFIVKTAESLHADLPTWH